MVGRVHGGGLGGSIISVVKSDRIPGGQQRGKDTPRPKGKIEVKGEYCRASSQVGNRRRDGCAAPFTWCAWSPFIASCPSGIVVQG